MRGAKIASGTCLYGAKPGAPRNLLNELPATGGQASWCRRRACSDERPAMENEPRYRQAAIGYFTSSGELIRSGPRWRLTLGAWRNNEGRSRRLRGNTETTYSHPGRTLDKDFPSREVTQKQINVYPSTKIPSAGEAVRPAIQHSGLASHLRRDLWLDARRRPRRW